MSTSLRLLAVGALFAAAATFAATPRISHAATPPAATTKAPAKARTPQQQRMADCSHQAKTEGKKGPERRAFMSTCLKGAHAATTDTSPQHKTKAKVESKANAAG